MIILYNVQQNCVSVVLLRGVKKQQKYDSVAQCTTEIVFLLLFEGVQKNIESQFHGFF